MNKKIILLLMFFCFCFISGCKNKNSKPIDPIEDKKEPPVDTTNQPPVVKLSQEEFFVGDKITFTLENYPSMNYLKVECSNPNAFIKNSDGSYSCLEDGEYTFTFSLIYDLEKQSSVTINVYKKIFDISATTDTLKVGDSIEYWIFSLEGLKEKNIDDFNFTLTNELGTATDIAKIEGLTLKSLKPGICYLVATSKLNNTVTAKMQIMICEGDEAFYIRCESPLGKIKVGEEVEIYLSKNFIGSNFRWSTTDGEVIRVTSYENKVKITGVGEGTASVVCFNTTDPTIKANYFITVNGTSEVDYISRMIHKAYDEIGTRETGDNIQKYGKWYGNNGQPWCATFVSWCWWHSGLSNALLEKYQSCSLGMQWCIENNIFKYAKDQKTNKKYIPESGDIVFFLSAGASHTGIVAYCDGTYIYTIEGNRSNKVGLWRLSVDNATITGYGHPNYPMSNTHEDFSWIKNEKWTAVTNGEPTV